MENLKTNIVDKEEPVTATEIKAVSDRSTIWLRLSIVAAILAMVGNVVALMVDSIYTGLTAAFLPQAIAQDIAWSPTS